MPEGVYGLGRQNLNAFKGPLRRAPLLPVRPRQSASSGSAALSFSLTPLARAVLFVGAWQNSSSSSPSISGGGVTSWNLIYAGATGDANNTSFACWWGVVDTTPSASVTAGPAGASSSCTVGAEFIGLRGIERAKGGLSAATLSDFTLSSTSDGGVVVYIAGGFSVSSWSGGLVQQIDTQQGRRGSLWYGAAEYQKNNTLLFPMIGNQIGGGGAIIA